MKRLLPILLSLGLMTACMQAGQVLTPGNFSATAPKSGNEDQTASDISSDTSSSSSTAPDAVLGDPVSKTRTTIGGTGSGGGETAYDPIEPKSDSHGIHHGPKNVGGEGFVRLRYGPNFETVLGAEDETAKAPVANGEIHLPATLEMRDSPDSPWKASEGYAVRIVYEPNDSSSPLRYCDASVFVDYSPEEGGNVLFSNVSVVQGWLGFYHLYPEDPETHKDNALLNNDPVTPCSSGWQTLDSETSLGSDWLYMGSMDIPVQFLKVSNPQPATHQTTPTPILKP